MRCIGYRFVYIGIYEIGDNMELGWFFESSDYSIMEYLVDCSDSIGVVVDVPLHLAQHAEHQSRILAEYVGIYFLHIVYNLRSFEFAKPQVNQANGKGW